MRKTDIYSVGDWLVHTYYGVGQVKGIETKPLNQKRVRCYRVKTKDSIYWLPLNQDDNTRVRPVTSSRGIRHALKILEELPDNLEQDSKYWQNRVKEVRQDGSLIAISKLVRDLAVVQTRNKLTTTAAQAFEHYKERFLREWSIGLGIDIEQAQRKLTIKLDTLSSRAVAE